MAMYNQFFVWQFPLGHIITGDIRLSYCGLPTFGKTKTCTCASGIDI